jgi:cytochrome c oxidase cbb3-type subunit 1
MDWFVKAFIRASLAWFTLGILFGLAMAAYPAWVIYRPAHAHMNVVGWITMMVFGVGYQLLPRLFGGALHNRTLAVAHFWVANAGLATMIVGFILAPHIGARSAPVTASGGLLFSIGALMFVYNMWRTFDVADARRREMLAQAQSPRKLPTAE